MIKTKKFPARGFFLLSLLAASLAFTGCGLWNNFTTYFNLYYNAERLFNESEQEIIQQKKNYFSIQDARPIGNASGNLTKVIEKLSKLLQFNAQSAYVDDALLMIGKSFFYQQDYQKAVRKFTELISTSPNSDLVPQARFWIAKTELRLKNYTQAVAILDELSAKALADKDEEMLSLIYTEQVGYFMAIEKYNDAIVAAQKLIEISDNDELNAAAMFEIGRLNLKLDQPAQAAQAFSDVEKYDPSFDIKYMSQIQLGKVQRRLGNNQSALDIFRDVEDEPKYKSYLDSTKLQIGLTYLEMKNFPEAVSQFVYIDTTFRQSPNTGVAEYYLGDIMENNYRNYDSAVFYYKKASTSTASIEYTQKAARKVQTFNKYTTLHQNLDNYNNQLRYAMNPEEFRKDSAAFVKDMALQDSLAKIKMMQQEDNGRDELQNSRNRRGGRSSDDMASQLTKKAKMAPVKPTISPDSLRIILVKNEYELGSLFFTELNVPDSAKKYYQKILDDYPQNVFTPKALFALGTYYQTSGDTVKADSIFNVIYKDYSRDDIVNAAAEKLGKPVVNLHYDAAEELFVEAEKKMKDKKFTEAVTDFQNIQEKFPKSPFAPKALLASGWVLENDLKLLDSAAVVYDSVISKYPTTQYANAVRGKVQVFKDEQRKIKFHQDSVAAARKALENPQPAADSLRASKPPAVDNTQGNAAAGQKPAAGTIQSNTVKQPDSVKQAVTDSSAIKKETAIPVPPAKPDSLDDLPRRDKRNPAPDSLKVKQNNNDDQK